MALIKCSECAKEISDKAKACPNCGAPIVAESMLVFSSNKACKNGGGPAEGLEIYNDKLIFKEKVGFMMVLFALDGQIPGMHIHVLPYCKIQQIDYLPGNGSKYGHMFMRTADQEDVCIFWKSDDNEEFIKYYNYISERINN